MTCRRMGNIIETQQQQLTGLKRSIADVKLELEDLKNKFAKTKMDLYKARNMAENPILHLLDQHFNNVYVISEICWSYINDDVNYCSDHKCLYYSNNCYDCVDYNFDKEEKPFEYYLRDNVYVGLIDDGKGLGQGKKGFIEIWAVDPIDKLTFDQINGGNRYSITVYIGDNPLEGSPHLFLIEDPKLSNFDLVKKRIKLIHYIVYCPACGPHRHCSNCGYSEFALLEEGQTFRRRFHKKKARINI